MFDENVDCAAAQAERLLVDIAPGAFCTAQEWDERIDCFLRLPDGTLIGEMILVEELTESRVRETGWRLQQWAEGRKVPLVRPILPPVRIVPTGG
jgi:hypothetical protein